VSKITKSNSDLNKDIGIDDNATSTAITIDASEKVGIGTSSPAGKLHINTDATASLASATINEVSDFSVGSRVGFSGLPNNSDGMYFGTGVDGGISAGMGFFREVSGWDSAIAFYTNNQTSGTYGVDAIQEAMRITSAGKVGIGTNSPGTKLDVNGTGRFSGSVTLGSNPSNPGSLVINDNSTTAYTMAIQGSSTRVYEMRGSSSGSSYSLNLLNTNTASGFHLNVYGGAVFNQNGDNFDFRVESKDNANMLFVDGGSNGVGIGTNVAGNSTLEVRSTGVDGTYTNAIGFQYSGNSNEANTISTSVSSNANSSGFKFNCSDGGGSSGKTSVLKITRADMVVNDDSYDYDFRVESDNMTHALFVQGNDGKVGVFNTAPRSTLEVGATNARHGIQLNGGPNGTATQIHMIDGKAGSYSTLTIEVQLGGAGGYFYQVQVAGTSGCKMQAGGGYTNGTNNFSHSTGSGSGFSVTSPSNNLIRLVSQGGVGTHPGCEIRMTQALSANHDQDNVTITWS